MNIEELALNYGKNNILHRFFVTTYIIFFTHNILHWLNHIIGVIYDPYLKAFRIFFHEK